jgi:hypothetical protein
MEQTYKITKKMCGIRRIFAMQVVNVSVVIDMWEKIMKVYPNSKRKIHYEEEKLNVNLWKKHMK